MQWVEWMDSFFFIFSAIKGCFCWVPCFQPYSGLKDWGQAVSWQQSEGCGWLASHSLAVPPPAPSLGLLSAHCVLAETSDRVQVGTVLVREWQRLKSVPCPFLRDLRCSALAPARANNCYAERCGKVTAQQTIKEFCFFEQNTPLDFVFGPDRKEHRGQTEKGFPKNLIPLYFCVVLVGKHVFNTQAVTGLPKSMQRNCTLINISHYKITTKDKFCSILAVPMTACI